MLSDDVQFVSSNQNKKIKEAASLVSIRKRTRGKIFLIEGYREVSRYLGSKFVSKMSASFAYEPLVRLFVCPGLFLGNNSEQLIREISDEGTEIIEVTESLFSRKLSRRDRPDGIIGVAPVPERKLSDLRVSDCPLIAVLESIEKPGNLGAILRSADAAGLDAVCVTDRVTDVWNPNSIRSSVGTAFTTPTLETTNEEISCWIGRHKMKVIVASPHGDVAINNVEWNTPIAIVLGSEQFGLSQFWYDRSHLKVALPMLGVADSLNVSTAAAVFFYFARALGGSSIV